MNMAGKRVSSRSNKGVPPARYATGVSSTEQNRSSEAGVDAPQQHPVPTGAHADEGTTFERPPGDAAQEP